MTSGDAERPSDRAESLPERLIREAMERGEFEGLAGTGEPIPDLDGTHDPDWWARRYVERERRRERAQTVAAETERTLGRVWLLPDEQAALDVVERLNAARRRANVGLPPDDRIDLIQPGEVVRTWRTMASLRR